MLISSLNSAPIRTEVEAFVEYFTYGILTPSRERVERIGNGNSFEDGFAAFAAGSIADTRKGNLLDEKGVPIRMNRMMLSDAIATCTGAVAGTSTVTTFVEASSGV